MYHDYVKSCVYETKLWEDVFQTEVKAWKQTFSNGIKNSIDFFLLLISKLTLCYKFQSVDNLYQAQRYDGIKTFFRYHLEMKMFMKKKYLQNMCHLIFENIKFLRFKCLKY